MTGGDGERDGPPAIGEGADALGVVEDTRTGGPWDEAAVDQGTRVLGVPAHSRRSRTVHVFEQYGTTLRPEILMLRWQLRVCRILRIRWRTEVRSADIVDHDLLLLVTACQH